MAVILETTLGDITVDLYTQERPRTCLNFLKLCKLKFYNYCLFHSVQEGFLAQTGDPTGTGRGGQSIFSKVYGDQAQFFEAETNPIIKHRKLGTLSMVNNGNNMHGSQFFLTLGESLDYLDGVHTVFGEVSEGLDVLDKLSEAICDETHRPYVDIRVNHTIVLDDPFDDPPGIDYPDRSPQPTKEQMEAGRIAPDEEIDATKGKTLEMVEEMIKEKEAKARTQILEMVGDLPEAEVAPPDNVLFVCKLNPVTTDEDLEIIFSRFGKIGSCEVIRDHKTGESLQYAFIEFEEPESCERAYFKMDNVLIDDRRIHVDFSQSVSKVKWKGKGKGVEHSKDTNQEENKKPKYMLKDGRRKDEYKLVASDEDTRPPRDRRARRSDSPAEERPSRHRDPQRGGGMAGRGEQSQNRQERSEARGRGSNHRGGTSSEIVRSRSDRRDLPDARNRGRHRSSDSSESESSMRRQDERRGEDRRRDGGDDRKSKDARSHGSQKKKKTKKKKKKREKEETDSSESDSDSSDPKRSKHKGKKKKKKKRKRKSTTSDSSESDRHHKKSKMGREKKHSQESQSDSESSYQKHRSNGKPM
ncbi:PREDICTED: peptidyl-prolyl cis-trans isomerase-like 4 [Priapulus caudatus]|uniref:Peptidyl-prolyl cis-trans isomerase n=1 Tax=Priapulus caudatus TaxID=37621 RepID=A0ABM1E6Q2_PRICU|nr:PREDICTED: peptidyl-prolyl cis-trans isomerase-like 4 [Priapulus caudatus]